MLRAKRHAHRVNDSLEIARALEEIAVLAALSGENAFKVRAYERGARVVADLGERLLPTLEAGELTSIEGIGETLARQVAELVGTGRSSYLERLRAQHPPGAVALARIPGLTIRRIRALHDGLGIESVDELREACLAQRVRTLKGLGPKTEARLLAAIDEAARPAAPKRMLLLDARALAERTGKLLVSGGVASQVLAAGAVRRCEETIAQIELVVVTSDSEAVWQRVLRMPWVTKLDRASGIASTTQGVALALRFASADSAGHTLLTATGPVRHVQALHERATARGSSLSVLAGANLDACAGERAIYAALDIPYVPPEVRGSRDDLDPRGYADLLASEHITGMVHCHTLYSDGRDDIEAMARAAEARGMQFITITDHSPSAHYAGGVTLDRLHAQWDEIARVQEKVKVRILRGTESDITAEGALDYPDDVLERFDVIIASIHVRHRMDRAQMTERLVRALSTPIFKIWGHALGRILLSREPFECDMPVVLDALARSRGAIELNADPHRLDLPPEWIPHARERGIPFVVSVDAHSTDGLGVYELGVQMARRGGLRRQEVLNTLGADEFTAKVKPVA
jgi:DNA polymerase (family 10)